VAALWGVEEVAAMLACRQDYVVPAPAEVAPLGSAG
jgi:hypothetical protein